MIGFSPVGAVPVADSGSGGAVGPQGIVTSSPVLGAPVLHQTNKLSAVSLVASSPTLGRPSNTIISIGVSVGGLTLGVPTAGQISAPRPSAYMSTLASQPVALDPVGFGGGGGGGGVFYDFDSPGLVVSSPSLGAPVLHQANKLSAVTLAASSPTLGTPTRLLVAVGVGVSVPNLGVPLVAQKHALSAPALSTSSPTLPAPYAGAPRAVTLAASSPVLGTPAVAQRNALVASGLDVLSPSIGTPESSAFATSDLVVGAPQFTAPTIGMVHALSAGTLAVGSPTFGDIYAISMFAQGIVVASPSLGRPGPSVVYHLAAQGIVTLSPVFPKPALVGQLRAVSLSAGHPVLGAPSLVNPIGTTDKFNPQVLMTSGSDLIYRSAAGLEKAMADVDGQHLIGTYAEIVRDQWNPEEISQRNLPFLAWAMGVNLWEDDWDLTFKRWWVTKQWELKSQRGSLLGISRHVGAVGATVVSSITPPAKFFPGKTLTVAERAAYVARFPQLRVYPFAGRTQLPYLCFPTKLPDRKHNKNGCFIGPLRKFYPTSQDAGGRYMRSAELWDRGVITPLTMRVITMLDMGPYGVRQWDEVTLPGHRNSHWFLNQKGRFPLRPRHPRSQNAHGIFLGALDATAALLAVIPRDGSLELIQAKAQYQTLLPDNRLIEVYPDHVADSHQSAPTKLYAGPNRKQFLNNKFLPASNSWRFLYERWYLFDPNRVPDYRKASVYMGHARFGIHKYTAELKIRAPGRWRSWFLSSRGFMRGHFRPANTSMIDKVRRAVTASMAARDTVRINTVVKRTIRTNDSLPVDGRFVVGQSIDA